MKNPERKQKALIAIAKAGANRERGPFRPQHLEALREKMPLTRAGLAKWEAENPDLVRKNARKASRAALVRNRELYQDDEWNDQNRRCVPLAKRLEIVSRWKQGEDAAALAREFGVSRRSIANILREQGEPGDSRPQPYHHYLLTAEQEKEVVVRWENGERLCDLRRAFSCSEAHIRNIIKSSQ
jgi:Mor family transcriptional regulator